MHIRAIRIRASTHCIIGFVCKSSNKKGKGERKGGKSLYIKKKVRTFAPAFMHIYQTTRIILKKQ
jgi:hypothetical protein